MILKLKQGVSLKQEQLLDVLTFMEEVSSKSFKSDYAENEIRTNVYDVTKRYRHAEYSFRVNLSFKLITLMKVI